MSLLISRLDALVNDVVSYEVSRIANLKRLEYLFPKYILNIKFTNINEIFVFKAMNLMGISLKQESLGQIQVGRYVQLLAITAKKDKKSRNISLGYFGKSNNLSKTQLSEITEFVLRWRYEKGFLNLNHYKKLLEIKEGCNE